MMTVPVDSLGKHAEYLRQFSQQWGLSFREPDARDIFVLEMSGHRLALRKRDEPLIGTIEVDFVKGAAGYRRRFGGGRRQAIARATGLKGGAMPSIADATAGLGRDAFVLASLGCRVHMIERSPLIAALLADGLTRAQHDKNIGTWVSERISLSFQDGRQGLSGLSFKPDVILLDPMFPEKKKSALVKKEMRILKSLLGSDPDAEDLLDAALAAAQKRVVVKRPAYADNLAGRRPTTSIKTLKNRFDIYLVSNGKQQQLCETTL